MKKILLIHPEGNVNDNPNLTGIVEILCEGGYAVEIVSPSRPDISQKKPCEGATFRLVDFPDFRQALYYGFLFPPEFASTPEALRADIDQFFGRVDLVIGVDRGIFEASVIARALNVPYGLISYEIFSVDETGQAFKEQEILACRGISFAVCQDRVRAGLLSKENEIPPDMIIDIPVSGRGFRPSHGKTFRIHDSLKLGRDTRIALYMGSITLAWSMIGELLETLPRWPSDWVLLLHHRYGTGQLRELYERFPFAKDSKKIYASPFEQLDFKDLPLLLHDVDLGLAFYRPMENTVFAGNNLKHIGMASGKIATYLQHGLPVMVNNVDPWKKLIETFDIGRVVDSASRIPDSLETLSADELKQCSANVREFFTSRLDLDCTIQPLMQRISQLMN